MPPPSTSSFLHLSVLPTPYFVIQLQPGQGIPQSIVDRLVGNRETFLSITRTPEEISIAGESYEDTTEESATWSCIKIKGPMEHGLVGIMAAFTAALKEAAVPVFAISTWNTDFVLVPVARAGDAVRALKTDGWVFEE